MSSLSRELVFLILLFLDEEKDATRVVLNESLILIDTWGLTFR
jgi:hypothetical protein